MADCKEACRWCGEPLLGAKECGCGGEPGKEAREAAEIIAKEMHRLLDFVDPMEAAERDELIAKDIAILAPIIQSAIAAAEERARAEERGKVLAELKADVRRMQDAGQMLHALVGGGLDPALYKSRALAGWQERENIVWAKFNDAARREIGGEG